MLLQYAKPILRHKPLYSTTKSIYNNIITQSRTYITTHDIRTKQGFIIDMDGVLYYQKRPIDDSYKFIEYLQQNNKKYLFLTNSSERSPEELSDKIYRIMNIRIDSTHFYSSALSTAAFLSKQKPKGTAYVIGEPG